MSDLEGLANRLLDKGAKPTAIIEELVREILSFRETNEKEARNLASAVLEEVQLSRSLPKDETIRGLLTPPRAGVTMGVMGVGSRGAGDLFVHRHIAKIAEAGGKRSLLGPRALDDAGAVEEGGVVVVAAVDGAHSRLSNYPFLAGFHVARASLRDVYVKGARPVALIDDLHLADDGDVGRLFDFVAGVSAVSDLAEVPLVAGSTLRVGGDMVIGDRMVSCVGAVGLVGKGGNLTARRNIKVGDSILMTEGAGGGTVATTAIYSGSHDVVLETLNVNFLDAAKLLLDSGLIGGVHAMTDVTNGGLRGDAEAICDEAGAGLIFIKDAIEGLINPKVLGMLRSLSIDPLGISLDSLLIFTPQPHAPEILQLLEGLGIRSGIVGEVVEEPRRARIKTPSSLADLAPRFRESAYTKVKKLVGEEPPEERSRLEGGVVRASEEAEAKRRRVVDLIRGRSRAGRVGGGSY